MASGRKHAAQPRAPVPARGAGKNRPHATPGWGAWEPLAATGGGAGGGGRRAARGLGGRCRRCCCGMLGRRRPSLSQLLGSLGGQWRSSGAQRRLLVRGGLLWRLLPDQLVLLLECLLEERTLCARSLQRLERVYGLREQDAEVRHRWCELVVKHKYTDAYGDIETFLRDDQWSPDFLMPLRNTTSRWRKKQVLLRPSLCRPRWRQGHPLNLSGSSNKSPDTLTMGHSRSEIIFAGAMGVYLYGELMVSEDAKQQELARRCFAAVQDDMDASSLRVVQEMLF